MFEHSKNYNSASKEVQDTLNNFWQEYLKVPLPQALLPIDFKHMNNAIGPVGTFEFGISTELSIFLSHFAQENQTTVSNVAFTAYILFMQRLTSQSDLLVGLHTDHKTFPFRLISNNFSSFKSMLKEVEKNLSSCSAHLPIDFSTLLSKDFIQSFFISTEKIPGQNYTLNTMLDLYFCEDTHSDIKIIVKYRSDLFKPISIERFVSTLQHILMNVNRAFDEQKLIPEDLESLLLTQWNQPSQSIDHLMPAYKMFEQIADLNPKQIAVENSKTSLSYEEVEKLSNRCAQALLERGINSEDLIAVILPRTLEIIPVILGILKAGAGYVPIDATLPNERLTYMLKDSRPKFVIDVNNLDELINFQNDQRPQVFSSNDCTQYVIYTSGSTGNPKGVQVAHKSFSNLMNIMAKKFHFTSKDKILAVTSLSFDVAASEFFLPLVTGGTLFLASEEEVKDGGLLKEIIESKSITMLQATPSTWRMILASGFLGKPNLRVHCGGEAFPADLAHKLLLGNLEVWNMYGPTETTVLTSCQKISASDEFITIGKPLANITYYVLDDSLRLLPIGSVGALYIGGHAVSKGYLNRAKLNTEKFLPNPFMNGALMYATGDLVRLTSDGEVIWCGRNDDQVKIRGHRIELDEIISTILKFSESKNAAVKIFEISGDQFLCAYITSDESINRLRDNLKKHLPQYMVPNFIVKLPSIPLSPSGKIDVRKLSLPDFSRPALNTEYASPETPNQQAILQIWASFLMIKDIGIDDNFFDLGGTSLMAVKVLNEINQFSKRRLTIADIFQLTTIRQLATFISHVENTKEPLENIPQYKQNLNSDIAIISMTGRFPGAENVDEFWNNLLENKNSIATFSNNEAHKSVTSEQLNDPNFVKAYGELPGFASFDYKFFGLSALAAELMDPQQRKFLELTYEALELAGYSTHNHPQKIGLFAGMGSTAKYSRLVDETPVKIAMLGEFNLSLGLEKDYLSTFTAFKLNLQGPALSINTACSTSLVAVIEAVRNLRVNSCDIAIAGGISIGGNPKTGHLHQSGGITSNNAECRPFDETASGTVFTDGAGLVVLKRLSDAEKDNDNILAVIKGVGLNNDGAHKMSFTAPSMLGQSKAILMAHQDAGIMADSIGFVEAHGTATPVGDPIEVEGLTSAFQNSTNKKNFCYVGSVKSNVGHTNTAAGITGLIKAIKVVSTGIIPATLHYKKPNSLLNLSSTPFVINNQNTIFPPINPLARAGVSSFGVGGTNAHIIIEEYKKSDVLNVDETSSVLFKLSAKSSAQVEMMKSHLISQLKKADRSEWQKIAYTLDVGRIEYNFRTYVVASSLEDLNYSTFVSEKKSKKLVFMFPGQGSHYAQMGKGLYTTNLIFRKHVDECAQLLKSTKHSDILNILFEQNEEKLSDTFYSQPAIFIIEYSLAMTLIHLGAKPEGFVGHSIGEFVAAVLNGVFTLEEGLMIISKRAELMQKVSHGKMISVPLKSIDAEVWLENFSLDIAAVNSHDSCVVAGDSSEIERFRDCLNSLEIASVELNTSHAFHSRMMKSCYTEFKTFLDEIPFKIPAKPMMSTVTAKKESDLFATADYWANHMLEPVQFYAAIKNLLTTEGLILLEVGPKNILSSLAMKTSRGLSSQADIFSTLSISSESEDQTFLKTIGKLWSLGIKFEHFVDLIPLNQQKRTIAPVYEFERNHLWAGAQPLTTNSSIQNKGIIMDTQTSTLKNKLKSIFEEASGINADTYSTETSFLELGMDSLFLSQFSMVLKKELQVQITFRQMIEEFNTIDKLTEHLSGSVKITELKVQPAQAPAIQITSPAIQSADSSNLQDIINRQLDLMAQQIALLKGDHSEQSNLPSQTKEKNQVKENKSTIKKVEVSNIKSAFGAIARISTEKTPLNDFQLEQVNQFIDKYTLKTKNSKKFTQDNRRNHADPRAVTGFKPESKEIIYPIVIKKSDMQTLWDIDGNKYIDMINGFGSNFFGNGNPVIKKHVLNQVEEGMEIGPQHPLVSKVSLLINELTGNERTAFCNTGSEAVLGAMRIARTVTGREKIIVFSGSYHGIHDEVIIRGTQSGKVMPAAPGINNAAVSNMIVLDYGTTESLNIIRELAPTVAAVLVEPVQSRRCDFQPVDFLKEVRKITEESKTCLIFDEIITGFRVNLAGAQGFFGIRADICTYGKIIGGGMPIGVVSGKAEYLDALDGGFWQYGDDSTPTVGVTYFAGTFVRHPLALASALGALEVLKTTGAKGLANLNLRSQKFVDELNLFLMTENIPMEINNFGSLIKPKWTADVASGDLFFAVMRYNGVHVYDGFPWFINLAHTDKELAEVLNAFKNAVRTMQRMSLFPTSKNTRIVEMEDKEVYLDAMIFDQKGAPMPGAKIGRDEQGNPAWFVEDPEKTGQYYLLKK